ncbi:MAG: hypothetical protein H6811_10825 [Phycisphaeraceae bacterium]|nr:hypothetical protein [Phycisphaeraceae bacterium]
MTPIFRRAVTLIEAVAAVTVLAIIVPPTVSMLVTSANGRADSVMIARASALADLVLEHVLADSCSDAPGLGFDALSDPDAYLETTTTGLYDRLSAACSPYANVGLSFSLEISGLVSATGEVTGDAGEDVYRVVTVIVRTPMSSADPLSIRVSSVLCDLS